MNKALFSVFLLFISNVLWAQPEVALIKGVKAKIEKVANYTATGQMKVDVAFINAPPSNVVMYYKEPNKFTIKKEGGISILPKGGVSVNLNSLLVGNNYIVVPAGTATLNGQTLKVVKLLPNNNEGDVVLTTFYIDEKALLIKKAAVTTKESGSYEIMLEYGKWASWGLPDKMVFEFSTKDYKLPKGVTFEYEKGTKKAPAPKENKGRVEIIYRSYTINKGVSDAVFSEKK